MTYTSQALDPDTVETALREGKALVLDTRDPHVFVKGFIPGAVNIGLDGDFAFWAGTVIRAAGQPLVVTADAGREEEAMNRLLWAGQDRCIGFLKGGFASWQASGRPADRVDTITAEEFADAIEMKPVAVVLDVRRKQEYDAEHMIGAENFPLDGIYGQMDKLDRCTTYYVYCADGYRSVIFISILKTYGFTRLVHISGGFGEIRANGRMYLSRRAAPEAMP